MKHEELRAKLKERVKSPESIKENECFKEFESAVANILAEDDLNKYVLDEREIDKILPMDGTKKGI
jgi:hypothetical protein